jgi:rhodanese-related sulfurtransferase
METLVPESYISPQQAFDMQSKGALIIDVREEFEFADKGIDLPQVYNFPLQKLEEQYLQIPKKKPLILVCAIGFCSEKAAKILFKKGMKHIFILQGGILAWSDEGFPVYTNPETLPDELSSHSCSCGNAATE